LRAKDTPAQKIKCCERSTWNERFIIETNLSWVTELFDAKSCIIASRNIRRRTGGILRR
jgi:hypothetical protein